MLRRFYWSLLGFLAFLGSPVIHATDVEEVVAFLGDSISTGAVAHNEIRFDKEAMISLLDGHSKLENSPEDIQILTDFGFESFASGSPQRLWYSSREFQGGAVWLGQHIYKAIAIRYLDRSARSWGYLLGRKSGFSSDQILIAAENGARMAHSRRQLDRVLDHLGGRFPRHLFIFFTGNDLCGPNMDFVSSAEEYVNGTLSTLDYIYQNRKNGPEKSEVINVYLVDPIGAVQLALSNAIQDKRIQAHGENMTCRQLHRLPLGERLGNEHLALYFLPRTSTAMCPTMLINNDSGDWERLGKIGKLIQDYRTGLGRVVREQSAKMRQKGVALYHVEAPGKWILEGDDIAQDCFHLSLYGQSNLARMIFNSVKSSFAR